MRKIFTIGETVLDIIFKNNIPIKAVPGGSMLNTAVSLGRLNKPVYFISEFANDLSGKLIMDFLKENNVNTDNVYLYKDGHTILAMAFLDEDNNALYDFYKIPPEKRFDINFPELKKDDIFLFGSFFSLDKEIRNKLSAFVSQLKKRALIIYDPNFRKPHLNEKDRLLPFIKENISFADIVKGSDEDFKLIFNKTEVEEIYSIIMSYGCKNLIITRGGKDVILKTENFTRTYEVNRIEIKSTIGAGDNFNAGILYSLFECNTVMDNLYDLNINIWDIIIKTAISFAQNVCQSYDNYIDRRFNPSILQEK